MHSSSAFSDSPHPPPASDDSQRIAAELLRNARWMAGLTQEEVAQRAGVARQVVSRYEAGQRQPTLQTLDRLLVGCGMRLRLSVVPEPGLEDGPTLHQLAASPESRIDPQHLRVLAALAAAMPAPESLLVSGKVAGQLHGGVLRAYNVEVVVSDAARETEFANWLLSAGVRNPFAADEKDLQIRNAPVYAEHFLEHGDVTIILRVVPHFDGRLDRSVEWSFSAPDCGLPGSYTLRLDSPDDCVESWHPRDRDRLAVQRAIRLQREPKEAPSEAPETGPSSPPALPPRLSGIPKEWVDIFM